MRRKSVDDIRDKRIKKLEKEVIEDRCKLAEKECELCELKGQCIICEEVDVELDNGICESCKMEKFVPLADVRERIEREQ